MSKTKGRKKKAVIEQNVLGVSVRALMQTMCERRGIVFRQVCMDAGLSKDFVYGKGGMNLDALAKFFSVVEPTQDEGIQFLDMLAGR